MARRSTKTTTKATVTAPVVQEVATPVVAEISNETLIPCRNGTAGNLIYKSTINPCYVVEWDGFGDVQEVEFRELVSMRGTQRRFFTENWILLDDPAVIKKLGVEAFYKNSLSVDDVNDVFSMSAAEIKETVTNLPSGTKDALAALAKEKIEAGEFDSRSAIKALSDSLSIDLEDNI